MNCEGRQQAIDHERAIRIGKGVIPFEAYPIDRRRLPGWPLPGGDWTTDEQRAIRVAMNIDEGRH